jgi:hypothetical protein
MTALFIRGGKEKSGLCKANLLLAKIGVLLAANLLLVRCPCTFDLKDAFDANGSPGGDSFSAP